MLITMYSKDLTHPEPALPPRHSCNIAILPYRSLIATIDAAILFTAYIHALPVLVHRCLRLSLSLAYRSSPHTGNALHVATISLIAPYSRGPGPAPARDGSKSETLLKFPLKHGCPQPLLATCSPVCRNTAVWHFIEHCDPEVAKQLLRTAGSADRIV